METRVAVFQGVHIRKTTQANEWWFVIEDIVRALTGSADPKQYIQRTKQRDPELKKGWVQIVRTLSVETDGGPQKMVCANTEGIFRIIQSIPSRRTAPRLRRRNPVVRCAADAPTGRDAGNGYSIQELAPFLRPG